MNKNSDVYLLHIWDQLLIEYLFVSGSFSKVDLIQVNIFVLLSLLIQQHWHAILQRFSLLEHLSHLGTNTPTFILGFLQLVSFCLWQLWKIVWPMVQVNTVGSVRLSFFMVFTSPPICDNITSYLTGMVQVDCFITWTLLIIPII